MSRLTTVVTGRTKELLAAAGNFDRQIGLLAEEAGVQVPSGCSRRILNGNVGSELLDKSGLVQYPAVFVYCERLENKLREKFRLFSGTASMVAEIRVSQDRLDGLEKVMQIHVDALLSVLESNRGDWGSGMFYTGGYEVVYGQIKQGGRNFIQAVKVNFTVEISSD